MSEGDLPFLFQRAIDDMQQMPGGIRPNPSPNWHVYEYVGGTSERYVG